MADKEPPKSGSSWRNRLPKYRTPWMEGQKKNTIPESGQGPAAYRKGYGGMAVDATADQWLDFLMAHVPGLTPQAQQWLKQNLGQGGNLAQGAKPMLTGAGGGVHPVMPQGQT